MLHNVQLLRMTSFLSAIKALSFLLTIFPSFKLHQPPLFLSSSLCLCSNNILILLFFTFLHSLLNKQKDTIAMEINKEIDDNTNTNTNTTTENDRKQAHKARRRRCLIAVGATIIVLIMVIFIVILVLALTIFKPKQPKTELISTSVEGVSPHVSLPAVRIELNITLHLKILVENRNYASLQHNGGKSLLFYRDNQVGDADIFPGNIPARGSTTLSCRLTIEVDQIIGPDLSGLISAILSGELDMETRTTIPGRVTFLGFIKKHVVAVSTCQLTVGLLDMKIRDQVCESQTKI